MKFIHKLSFIWMLVLIPIMSCNTDELQELNIDPNAANEVDWRFLFTSGQVQAAENRQINGRVNISLCAQLIQHCATTIGGGERGCGDKYTLSLDNTNAYMDLVYENALKELSEVIRQTGPDGVNPTWVNLNSAATIMSMINYHVMTDLYGNIPYSEANKGIEGIFIPNYDQQEFIYNDMMSRLEIAAGNIGTGPDEIGSADIMFNGDFEKWRKFANSLMLRLAMRISNVDPATAQSFAERAISGGVMTSNDDMAWIPMADGPSQWFNQNGISRSFIPDDWGSRSVLSATMIDFLRDNGDPRLFIYSAGIGPFEGPFNTNAEEQIGLPNGLDQETVREFLGTTDAVDEVVTFSRVNPLLLDVADPFIFQTYAEVELLLAEAALKGWGGMSPADAEAHYNEGVKASMQMWTIFDESLVVDDADVETYLAANPFDGSEQMIGEQYWAATFLNWYESYANWRRTGFPELVPVNYPGNISGGQIYRRFTYFTDEVATNPNVLIDGTQPDNVMTRVWWDVQ